MKIDTKQFNKFLLLNNLFQNSVNALQMKMKNLLNEINCVSSFKSDLSTNPQHINRKFFFFCFTFLLWFDNWIDVHILETILHH